MRFLQIPLWLCIALGVAVYLGSVDKNLATALIFASIFGLVYGGSASLLKRPSVLGKKPERAYRGRPGSRNYKPR